MLDFWTESGESLVLLEGLLDLRDARVLLHHQEIRFSVLVQFADATEQEAGACVLVTDNSDQFPASGHHRGKNLTFNGETE